MASSSDIPGFYYDSVQRRYYRLTDQSSNATPSARRIHERARQEELIAKQLNAINATSTRPSRLKSKSRRISSRFSLLRQRQYGHISAKHYHQSIRSSFIEHLPSTCLLDDHYSFSLSNHRVSQSNYELFITSTGQCIQLIDYYFYLTDLNTPRFSYRLPSNSLDGVRSSYFMEGSSFMSTSLLHNDEHVMLRFLRFSSSATKDSSPLISDHPTASTYFYEEKQHLIDLSSSTTATMNYSSPLMIKCTGPCCYFHRLDVCAFNLNNDVYIYDLERSQIRRILRVPIRRVTLSDMKFSLDNANLIYTTNGHQCQQWDLRESHRSSSSRIPILCTKMRLLQTKSNCLLASSFDERIQLIDLRFPTKPLLIYQISPSSTPPTNPHFSFTIDNRSESFLAACSQDHITNVWDVHSGRLLNRLRCLIPERWIHTTSRCSMNNIDQIPRIAIFHPEYCRITNGLFS